MIPKLRFPEFTEAWNEKSIGDIATISRGRFSPRPRNDPRYYGGDTEFIQTSEVVGANPNILYGLKSLNEKGVKVSKVFPSGTIVMTIAANIGYVGFANRQVAFPDSLVGINAFEDILPKYLFYVLSRKQRRLDYIAEEAAQKNITSPTVRKFKIWHTTNQKEQVALTNLFELINLKINLLTKKKEALETHKKGLIQKLFSQELRFKREDGTDYPEWSPTPLKAILKERKTLSSDTDSIELVSLTKEGVVAKSDRYNRAFLVKDASKKYKMTLLNDICYNPANLKFGVICRNTFGKALFSPIYVTFEVNDHLAENSFIELFVTTQNFIQKALKYQEGTVYERMAVKPDDLVRSIIQLPCIDEQKRIVFLIEALAAKEEILRSTIESTKLLKKGLLQQMFV